LILRLDPKPQKWRQSFLGFGLVQNAINSTDIIDKQGAGAGEVVFYIDAFSRINELAIGRSRSTVIEYACHFHGFRLLSTVTASSESTLEVLKMQGSS
jgi:hypothetical protein